MTQPVSLILFTQSLHRQQVSAFGAAWRKLPGDRHTTDRQIATGCNPDLLHMVLSSLCKQGSHPTHSYSPCVGTGMALCTYQLTLAQKQEHTQVHICIWAFHPRNIHLGCSCALGFTRSRQASSCCSHCPVTGNPKGLFSLGLHSGE